MTVSPFRSQWLILPGLALLLLTTLYLAREPLLLAIGDFLVVQDPLQPADLIAVVSGDPRPGR